MSPKRIVTAVAVILALVLLGPGFCAGRVRHGEEAYNYEHFVQPNEGRIREALLARLAERPSPACVATPRMPYDSLHSGATCDACDALADAGLLDKSVETVTGGESSAVSLRFALTPAGQPLYTEARIDTMKRRAPGLCFGTVVLREMKARVTAHFEGRIFVRYTLAVEDPHEILFGPAARTLGLPQLHHGIDGTVLPAQEIEAWAPNGNFQSLQ